MLWKSTLREIWASKERYFAIMAIIALGVCFFAGLKVTKPAMISTCREYLTDCNMFDYKVATSYGIDDRSVSIAEECDSVETAEASIEEDTLILTKKEEYAYKAISLPEKINRIQLRKGRMPEAANECAVDISAGYKPGDIIKLSSSNTKENLKHFKYREYKVTGLVSSPIYLDYQRGSGKLGDGTIAGFFYIKKDGFCQDYSTALYIKMKNSAPYFSNKENSFLKKNKKQISKTADEINAERRDAAIKEALEKLRPAEDKYNEGVKDYNSQKASAMQKLAAAEKELNKSSRTVASKKSELKQSIKDLDSKKGAATEGLKKIDAEIAGLEALGDALDEEQQQILAQLKDQRTRIQQQISEIDSGINQCRDGLNKIAASEKKIEKGRAELAANRKKADSEFAEAEAELKKAGEKIDKAREKIDNMKKGKAYVMTRADNMGFAMFEENSGIVDGIARIFPLFFFLVAALVCMTTMTRMIDEHRTQIGVLKAIGCSNPAILGKYMFYSGSAAFAGTIIGFFAGCNLFPAVIWHAYQIMYNFEGSINFVFHWKLGLFVLAGAMLCGMGATWVSCMSDFRVQPSELIRPKSPKAGKRILLESIGPLWRKISFLYKVSIRNTFRYKKRFFMMVLGISGCTALLIAGFGINTTIKNVANFQYEEVIRYDYMLIFEDNMDKNDREDFLKYCREDVNEEVGDVLFLHEEYADVKIKGVGIQTALVATDDKRIDEFIDLHDGLNHLNYPGRGEAIVCREMQQKHNINVGDAVTITDGNKNARVTVSGVCDNYVDNYIYITEETYRSVFGEAPRIKTALVKAPDNASDGSIRAASTSLKKYDNVAAVYLNLDTVERVNKMMRSLNAVVVLVILCAGLLAFIVLYNLTNINITERIREIATIKVLGFEDGETNRYVFRENYILTAIAALAGIPLGTWMLRFIISQININTIFFVARVTPVDYVLSIVLTFVFAVIVSLAMRRRLKNISMTESLKSME